MISTQDQEINKYLYKSKIKTTKTIKITKHKSKFREDKTREEKREAKIVLEPSYKHGMESLQIFTSTHSRSL